VSPHTLRHAFITAVSTPGCRSATCRRRRRTPTRERQCVMTGRGCHWTGTPPTSSPRSWRGRPGSTQRQSDGHISVDRDAIRIPMRPSPTAREGSLAQWHPAPSQP
jgi:hypothetical protein